jgi:hypothetical protein
MKQVLLTLGILLVAMLGFYWVSARYQPKKTETVEINDREIYFEAPGTMTVGVETEISLKARYNEGKVVSFDVDFNYDMAVMEVLNVELNKEIFDKKAQSKIDESFGKVMISGENGKDRSKLSSGDIVLAKIKIKGLKKGGTMIYSSKKPETGVLEGGKIVEGNFQMPNFKVNFL